MQMRITETIKRLLIAYVAVFLVQMILGKLAPSLNFSGLFALIPAQVMQGRIWQIFTYSFLHADVMHLVLNCLVLAFLGSDIELLWGRKKFLAYYFLCSTVGALFYLMIQVVFWNPVHLVSPMVGASAGIYGLMMAYGILFSERQLLFMMMFPMKASHFIWVLAGVEFLQALFSEHQSELSAFAHLSGMGAGYLFLWLQAKGFRMARSAPRLKPKKNHLRLVQTERDTPVDDDENPRGPRTWH